jgi:8-oxo-dGTP pyrophosphatase MutT (NUDIX family)
MGSVPDPRANPRLEFSAGGLVVDDQSRVLLIRARDLRDQPVWTLPKGALVAGETSAAAALREVREETGYRCEVVRELEHLVRDLGIRRLPAILVFEHGRTHVMEGLPRSPDEVLLCR